MTESLLFHKSSVAAVASISCK